MVGLGAKGAMINKQGPSKKCERCELSYFSNHHDGCPHCTGLTDSELVELREMKDRESEGGAIVGRRMLVAAALLVLLMILLPKLLA